MNGEGGLNVSIARAEEELDTLACLLVGKHPRVARQVIIISNREARGHPGERVRREVGDNSRVDGRARLRAERSLIVGRVDGELLDVLGGGVGVEIVGCE